jgi:hypothetical protein
MGGQDDTDAFGPGKLGLVHLVPLNLRGRGGPGIASQLVDAREEDDEFWR